MMTGAMVTATWACAKGITATRSRFALEAKCWSSLAPSQSHTVCWF
jgi:hypothetical protein